MERRIALTLAGTAAIVVVSGAAAMAANLGILDIADAKSSDVGKLDAENVTELVDPTAASDTTTSVPGPQVVYVDQYDIPPANGTSSPGGAGSGGEQLGDGGATSDPSSGTASGDPATGDTYSQSDGEHSDDRDHGDDHEADHHDDGHEDHHEEDHDDD